jgi:hypothetical protein
LFTIHLLQLQHRISYASYFYTYWATQSISIALGFSVVYEIYRKVFQNYDAIRRFGGIIFASAAVALLGVVVLTAASAPGVDVPGIIKAVVLLERSVRLMQCGLLAFLFLLTLFFGLPWRNYLFGIALGFGAFATMELVALAVRSHMGAIADNALSQINSGAFDGGVLIWVCYLLAPEPAPQYAGLVAHNDLERWNQALLEMLQR